MHHRSSDTLPCFGSITEHSPNQKAAIRDGGWIVLGHWDGPDITPGGSLRKGDIDLIKKHQLVDFELYNLKEDPSQSVNLATSNPERLQSLSIKLVEKYSEIQGEGKRWND